MPVVEATDGMRLAPNHVYLSTPGRNLALLQGVLHVMDYELGWPTWRCPSTISSARWLRIRATVRSA